MYRNAWVSSLVAGVSLALLAWNGPPAVGQAAADPSPSLGSGGIPVIMVPALDLDAIRAEDAQRDLEGLPPRYAIPTPTLLRPATDGVWSSPDPSVRVWRLRIASPGARSLNLGFGAYWMPPGGELWIYSADGSHRLEPYTSAHNADHGQLWTAVLLSDDIVVEAVLPAPVADLLVLELTSINVGYRGFGGPVPGAVEGPVEKSDPCEIDVICPAANAWRNEIPAVGVISTGGYLFCTGFMVNNTAEDQTPYFMTANHCDVNAGNAASLVVYWNFYSPSCGQHGGGSLNTHQSGSTFRAALTASDFTLVQLSQAPNPTWGITYAGWDRRDVNATSGVGIHHPNCDEKSISLTSNPTITTSEGGDTSPGDGTHLRVVWDSSPNRGVTEPGSSGSPFFDQNHRVLGQLHSGYSFCDTPDWPDWYGRFYRSWTGGGTNSTRLSNWLDAGNTGRQYVDTLNPANVGLQVSPATGLNATGPAGGPFPPVSAGYTLRNAGSTAINYQVSKGQPWVGLSGTSGTLAAGATTTVAVSIDSGANALGDGAYSDTVSFVNTTDHRGDTTRTVTLHVGTPQLVYSWNLDTNPFWTTQGQWAWGTPTGAGGDHGGKDPTAGHTGTKVYGYNLNGGYATNLPETHLTTTAIDCANLTQVRLRFWRWLGVEDNGYDHAYVRVSNNGTTWTTIWSNPASIVDDQAWVFQDFDISAQADGQPTVYIRWTMGASDNSWTFCGWNVDDIEIWGVSSCTAASITEHPQSGTRCVGDAVTFSVTAGGTEPLTYQWRKAGGDIGGATGSSYTINPVAAGDAGSYNCVVTNGCGSVTSDAAMLTVNTGPAISGQPQAQAACVGGSVTFSVTAGGAEPLAYQWRKAGGDIGGATGSSYTINPVAASDAASYDCVVTDGCGSVTSNAAALTVNTGPAISGQPASQAVCVGDSVTFSVTAGGTEPLTYQWRKAGGNISGATTSSYTINPVAAGDAGSYDCVVTNGCGSATSNAATLTVWPLGDVNCDGRVTFDDINAFVTALVGQAAYETEYPACRWLNADVDRNSRVTFDDINPFVDCLVSAGCP